VSGRLGGEEHQKKTLFLGMEVMIGEKRQITKFIAPSRLSRKLNSEYAGDKRQIFDAKLKYADLKE